ncbi:MAG: ATP-binding cassette domain-containing protein [Actinomycetales bacterium]
MTARAPGVREGVRLLLPFARHGWPQYAASALLALGGTAAQFLPYWAVYLVLRDVVADTLVARTVVTATVVALTGVVAMAGLLGAATWMSHRAAFATLEHLRLRIGRRLGEVPLGYLTRRRSGAVQRTINDDVERLESFLAHAVPDLVSAAGTLAGLTVWLLVVDVRMGLAAASVVALAVPLMMIGAGIGAARIEAYGRAMSRMNASIVEFVRGLAVVRTFQRGEDLFAETAGAIRDATRFQADWGRRLLPVHTGFSTLLSSNVVVVLPAGLWWWSRGELSTADLLFFLVLGLGYTTALLKVVQLTTQLGRLGVGAALVHELDRAPVLPEPAARAALGSPTVEFDGVSFAHLDDEGRPSQALREVSFTARPGTVTAVVGASGAGKSTLLRLVARFADVDSGAVRVAGTDVRDMPVAQLMDQVALVQQETFLFDDTVAANLRLARPDASAAELESAARAARIHDVVTALPDGYATRLGERGARLSGGERQRLSVARALLKDAPVVLLDEVTAHVDTENEVALQDALTALVPGRTIIVVAHRLSTVAGADQILVLSCGRIVERGRHEDLLAAGGEYARLWAAFVDVESPGSPGDPGSPGSPGAPEPAGRPA